MSKITRAGVDLAKNVIQVHAVDAAGKVVTGRALKRERFLHWCAELPEGCLVAMEACGGAHHWCRKLRERGLDARMIPAQFVTPYRIQGKTATALYEYVQNIPILIYGPPQPVPGYRHALRQDGSQLPGRHPSGCSCDLAGLLLHYSEFN